jgi:ribonuclease HII
VLVYGATKPQVIFAAISSAPSTTTAGNISSMSAGDSEKKPPEKKKRGRRRKPRPLGKNGKELSASAAKLRLLKRLRCTLKYEKALWAQGAKLIAGVDEVGRGALFGPVVAAAVILDPNYRIRGLRDSKLLEPEVRERLAKKIREHCIAYAIASVDSSRIDEINIYWASKQALCEAVRQLSIRPDHVLVDAFKIDAECPQTPIIHGDALSCSIAAASIIAKVERDSWMRNYDTEYPLYGLASNKGYSTPRHKAVLREHGPSPLHRQSFAPVWMANAPPPAVQDLLAFQETSEVVAAELAEIEMLEVQSTVAATD